MRSRLALLLGGVLSALVSAPACDEAEIGVGELLGEPSKLAIVFVDVSGSIREEDWNIYQQSFQNLLQALGPGDRIVVATISDRSLTGFNPFEDVEFEHSGILLQDEEAAEEVRRKLRGRFEELRSGPAAQWTKIMDATVAAGRVFGSDPDRSTRWLLLLSDMVEDSPELRFGRTEIDRARIDRIIADREEAGLLPDLSGTQVFVAGATAATAEKLAEIQRFWEAYFAELGASVEDYQRSAVRFAKK